MERNDLLEVFRDLCSESLGMNWCVSDNPLSNGNQIGTMARGQLESRENYLKAIHNISERWNLEPKATREFEKIQQGSG